MANATVAFVNAMTATRAQPASVRHLGRHVKTPTTLCATAGAAASAAAASVMKDTSVHTARRVSDVPILARLNCEDPSPTTTLSTSINEGNAR